jgi:type II secretory pathway pseudopilin PulG
MNVRSNQLKRAAYTLLELLLALALSVIIVGAITSAISVFLVNLNRQQRSLEQKQVARSVLGIFSNDFRAGLQYKAIDVSGIENLSASQALIAGLGGGGSPAGGGTDTGGTGGDAGDGGGDGGGGDGGGGEGGGDGSGGTDGGSAGGGSTSGGESADPPPEDTATFRPALIGSATALSIDISRLPRLDQYHALLTGGDLSSMTGSDVKTVSYFISSSAPASGMGLEFEPDVASRGGLYRRQIDRAVAAYQGSEGIPAAPDQYSQLISPEIVEIQFRYYDGSEWYTSWDSEETGGFPLAIEVTMVLDPARTTRTGSFTFDAMMQLETYRLVVHLPAAEAPPEEDE